MTNAPNFDPSAVDRWLCDKRVLRFIDWCTQVRDHYNGSPPMAGRVAAREPASLSNFIEQLNGPDAHLICGYDGMVMNGVYAGESYKRGLIAAAANASEIDMRTFPPADVAGLVPHAYALNAERKLLLPTQSMWMYWDHEPGFTVASILIQDDDNEITQHAFAFVEGFWFVIGGPDSVLQTEEISRTSMAFAGLVQKQSPDLAN